MAASIRTTVVVASGPAARGRAARSPFVQSLVALRHDRAAMVGVLLLLGILALAIFAPLIAPYDPTAV
jgi:peptide/nickel transport system permease protein